MNISTPTMRRCSSRGRRLLWQQSVLVCVILLMVGGCTTYGKQIRTYISGQDQVVGFPLRQVMLASDKGLEDLDFSIISLEFTQSGCLTQAKEHNQEATVRLEQKGRRVTRLHIDIYTGEGARDISLEEALLTDINALLNRGDLPSFNEFTVGMIPVHDSPDPGSPIKAYLGKGAVVSVKRDDGEWSHVTLLSGGNGYVASRHLNPAPAEPSRLYPRAAH